MNITYAEAEGIKWAWRRKFKPYSKLRCNRWGELRASLDFLNISRTAPCRRSMSPADRPVGDDFENAAHGIDRGLQNVESDGVFATGTARQQAVEIEQIGRN